MWSCLDVRDREYCVQELCVQSWGVWVTVAGQMIVSVRLWRWLLHPFCGEKAEQNYLPFLSCSWRGTGRSSYLIIKLYLLFKTQNSFLQPRSAQVCIMLSIRVQCDSAGVKSEWGISPCLFHCTERNVSHEPGKEKVWQYILINLSLSLNWQCLKAVISMYFFKYGS